MQIVSGNDYLLELMVGVFVCGTIVLVKLELCKECAHFSPFGRYWKLEFLGDLFYERFP